MTATLLALLSHLLHRDNCSPGVQHVGCPLLFFVGAVALCPVGLEDENPTSARAVFPKGLGSAHCYDSLHLTCTDNIEVQHKFSWLCRLIFLFAI